jgi:NAD dependent epimerase/dehydratase
MPFRNKRVLVTGAAGFIGSHLVQRLLALGAKVRAMVHYRADPSLHNLIYFAQDEMANVEVIKGNIEDPYFVRWAVGGCDGVFHLAALIDIPYSYIAPASYVATNVQGTLNVLEACRGEGTPRLVHTSTSECYGTARYTPIDEEHPLQGQSPYSASKIAADKMVESYHKSFELPVVTIRPFNTYGPRQSGRAVIPTIVGQLASGAKNLKLGALSPVRDFTFVSDTVEGLIRGALAEGVLGEVINLGFGKGIAIGELAGRIMDLLGITVSVETEEERMRPQSSEVMALISDSSRAVKKLKWIPKVSLENGLLQTIEFVRQHPELVRAN